MTPDVQVLAGEDALMHAAAELFVNAAAAAARRTGRFVVALSGGGTPQRLYSLLASDAYRGRVAWSQVHVCWGDERCVPPDDPASNYGMAREALLAHVPIADANIHRMHGEDDPPVAAAAYERELRGLLATAGGPPRLQPETRFDLVLLGMGDNGHTASLFPGLGAVCERQRWVLGEYVPEVRMWRLTLTPPVINAAAQVAFIVAGASKAAMLRRVLEGPRQPERLPAQAVDPVQGELRWLVDSAAAALLTQRTGVGA